MTGTVFPVIARSRRRRGNPEPTGNFWIAALPPVARNDGNILFQNYKFSYKIAGTGISPFAAYGGKGLLDFLGHCANAIDVSHGLAFSLFLAGLIGGFTHCSGMRGPFVIAQAAARGDGDENDSQGTCCKTKGFLLKRLADGALLPYHLGRITTYTGLAVIVSGLSNVAFMYSPYKTVMAATLLAIAGLMFMASAIPTLAHYTPWLKKFQFSFLSQGLARIARPFFIDPTGWRGYALGLMLGFLPCGLVMAALMAVAAAGSVTGAALAMAAFGLGTVPALFFIGWGSHAARSHWPDVIRPLSQAVMALNGVLLCAMAGRLVF